MTLDKFFEKSIVVDLRDDQFFVCSSIKVANNEVLFYDTKMFSYDFHLQKTLVLNPVDIFEKKSFTQPLSAWDLGWIRPIDQFSAEKLYYRFEPPKYPLVITFEINGELNELMCSKIYVSNNILNIYTPSHYEFLANYRNIAFNKKFGYQSETWQDYKGGSTWDMNFGHREVDFKILHDENNRLITFPFNIAKKMIRAIDLCVPLPDNDISYVIKKNEGILSAEIVINKLYKEVELLRITSYRYKEKDNAFKYSYDWFRTTKTERYSKKFLTDFQAEKCFLELSSQSEAEGNEFTIIGFDRSEGESTDWD